MKVLGINGSARKDGNTAIIMNQVFEELKKQGWHDERFRTKTGRSGDERDEK